MWDEERASEVCFRNGQLLPAVVQICSDIACSERIFQKLVPDRIPQNCLTRILADLVGWIEWVRISQHHQLSSRAVSNGHGARELFDRDCRPLREPHAFSGPS